MKPRLVNVRAVSGLLIVAGVAGLLVFVGMRLADGEPAEPAGTSLDVVELPSNLPTPPSVPPPVVPPAYSSVNIEGKQIPLPAGMSYARHATVHGRPDWPATTWLVKYDSDLTQPGESWLATDEYGFILGMQIRPGDEARFQPFLDAASKKPTPTPQPLVKIGGREVPLPAGMIYAQIFWSNVEPGLNDLAWVVTYGEPEAVSRLYIDDDAGSTVLNAEIRPEHLSLFAPLLAGGSAE